MDFPARTRKRRGHVVPFSPKPALNKRPRTRPYLMLAERTDPALQEPTHRDSFFRHSGWLMLANIAGGVFMYAVHLLNRFVPAGQYGGFGVALAVIILV